MEQKIQSIPHESGVTLSQAARYFGLTVLDHMLGGIGDYFRNWRQSVVESPEIIKEHLSAVWDREQERPLPDAFDKHVLLTEIVQDVDAVGSVIKRLPGEADDLVVNLVEGGVQAVLEAVDPWQQPDPDSPTQPK